MEQQPGEQQSREQQPQQEQLVSRKGQLNSGKYFIQKVEGRVANFLIVTSYLQLLFSL
jgi:hypothetical protein